MDKRHENARSQITNDIVLLRLYRWLFIERKSNVLLRAVYFGLIWNYNRGRLEKFNSLKDVIGGS